ncbi:unnamed protein product [Parascedosporium putredinis]|uniref:Clr5 domain-containing protein n=1 Tax=Parascedosporium putredinis TaxID=1442378 RepID=A0A9P1H9Q6_9PEZI|nr:unnamed protein product [Parascedosporium putredinis]CAI8001947.1 unnamed protein product [Parascedosporium putredinis]
MEHIRLHHSFTPSKRSFQSQFRKWDFPLKQNSVNQNDELLSRVRELWEQNLPQKEMLRILGQEGFDIKPRELVRLRSRNRLLLRDPRGDKAQGTGSPGQSTDITNHEPRSPSHSSRRSTPSTPASKAALSPGVAVSFGHDEQAADETLMDAVSLPLSPKPGRKPRGRARRRAGHVVDPTARPPRFPSETTLDEARIILGLDTVGYRAVRTAFQGICEECAVVKKTLAGPKRWETVKSRLVQEVVQLQTPLWVNQENIESKKLALDIICTDVTKRMRDGDKRITVSDAKRILAVNPEESRQLRSSFYQLLVSGEDQFTCKSKAGPEQWNRLMQQWIGGSEIIHGLLAGDPSTPGNQDRRKALDILASDVMKRLRDEKARKGQPKGRQRRTQQPEPPRWTLPDVTASIHRQRRPITHPHIHTACTRRLLRASRAREMARCPIPSTTTTAHRRCNFARLPADSMGISLAVGLQSSQDVGIHAHRRVEVAHHGHAVRHQILSGLLLTHSPETSFVDQQFIASFGIEPGPQLFHHMSTPSTAPGAANPFTPVSTIAVYLRPHPLSTYPLRPELWIATLDTQSLERLQQVAIDKYPKATCVKIEGVLKDPKGSELLVHIDDDGKLAAYLAHVEGSTPTFNVQLEQMESPLNFCEAHADRPTAPRGSPMLDSMAAFNNPGPGPEMTPQLRIQHPDGAAGHTSGS